MEVILRPSRPCLRSGDVHVEAVDFDHGGSAVFERAHQRGRPGRGAQLDGDCRGVGLGVGGLAFGDAPAAMGDHVVDVDQVDVLIGDWGEQSGHDGRLERCDVVVCDFASVVNCDGVPLA